MKAFLLLVLLGAVGAGVYFLVFDQTPTGDNQVRITSVDARFGGATGALTVVVSVDVEAITSTPPAGPYVKVTAKCDDAQDDVTGDVGLLGNLQPGDTKTDTVELFSNRTLANEPLRCEITARTSDGLASGAACIEHGDARPGGC